VRQETTKVVSYLDEMFRAFDTLCTHFGCQKIETVGKTYLASTGITECEAMLAARTRKLPKEERLLKMAFEMQRIARNIFYGASGTHRRAFQLKIGIHVGKVIAGVIGFHKPQFSLIGDTVNTTARVCTNSENGDICISAAVHERVKNSNFYFLARHIRPKGLVRDDETFLIYKCFEELVPLRVRRKW
jgi:class 3 adenylate cyclase